MHVHNSVYVLLLECRSIHQLSIFSQKQQKLMLLILGDSQECFSKICEEKLQEENYLYSFSQKPLALWV